MIKARSVLFLTCLVFAFAISASAGTLWVVPPEAPTYLINPAATGVDTLEAFIQTPLGVTFDGQGFSNLDAGWSSAIVNPTYAVEHGPVSNSLTETLNLIGSPQTVNFYAFTNGTLTDAFQAHFGPDGYTNWTALTADDLANENTATPEPATFALLGAGLIALGVASRKRAQNN
jgi:hypothetical protein